MESSQHNAFMMLTFFLLQFKPSPRFAVRLYCFCAPLRRTFMCPAPRAAPCAHALPLFRAPSHALHHAQQIICLSKFLTCKNPFKHAKSSLRTLYYYFCTLKTARPLLNSKTGLLNNKFQGFSHFFVFWFSYSVFAFCHSAILPFCHSAYCILTVSCFK